MVYEIQRKAGEITDELLKNAYQMKKDATVDTLRDRIKEQMVAGKKLNIIDDLKPSFLKV